MREGIGFGVRNLIKLCKQYGGFVLLFIISVVASLVTLYFSYGVYTNFLYEQKDNVYDTRSLQLRFPEGQENTMSVARVKQMVKEIDETMGVFYNNILFSVTDEANNRRISAVIEQNKSDYFFLEQSTKELVEKGRYFTEDELENGKDVCLTYWGDGRDILLFGKKYETVGVYQNWYGTDYEEMLDMGMPDEYMVPWGSIPDDAYVSLIEVHTGRMITKNTEDGVKGIVERYCGEACEYRGPKILAETEKEISVAMVLLALLLAGVSILNLYMIMDYLYKRRRKMLALVRICGGPRGKIMLGQMVETGLLVVMGAVVAMLLYANVFQGMLQKQFVYFDEIYTWSVYGKMTAFYLLVVGIFLTIRNAVIVGSVPLHIWRG